MTILDCSNTVYDNAIEMYFHEYFDNRGISIDGDDYKKVDNSVFEAAFRYVYKKLFKPDKTTVRYNNKKTKINLRDIDELDRIADAYINIIKDYAIVPFDKFFLEMTGIHGDTFNSWKNKEYKHGGLSQEYSELTQKIHCLSKEQGFNRLVDDKTGLMQVANNDPWLGMEYNNKRQLEEATARQLTSTDIRAMLTARDGQNDAKAIETQDVVVDDADIQDIVV